jgi:hypothetical protein
MPRIIHAVCGAYLLWVTTGAIAAEMQNGSSRPATVTAINAVVAAIDKQIDAKELDSLVVEYQMTDATEGVPPSFKFFYDAKTNGLIACEIHVGHETWSKNFRYYFDPAGAPLKYREQVIGREDKPAPVAIIYGPQSKILWKNVVGPPPLKPAAIMDLYATLSKRLEAFVR